MVYNVAKSLHVEEKSSGLSDNACRSVVFVGANDSDHKTRCFPVHSRYDLSREMNALGLLDDCQQILMHNVMKTVRGWAFRNNEWKHEGLESRQDDRNKFVLKRIILAYSKELENLPLAVAARWVLVTFVRLAQ